ncbi:MAG: RluA family pseudouridine synthase [Candidatus Absconditabacteria bacterium]|nr:RluA family pseudouridine synthase [Candidatus Absconditabacteria bacterium]
MKEIEIDSSNHDQRFDRFLRKHFKMQPGIALADIYRGIRNREITVNGKKAKEDYRVRNRDIIKIEDAFFEGKDANKKPSVKKSLPIDVNYVKSLILFEDDNWLVFNKPTGISIHPSDNEHKQRSMHDLLRAYIPSKGETFNASFGYRLDKETSGVLIAGKTYDSLQYINEIIRNRQIQKEYLAIVVGRFPKQLSMHKPLKKIFSSKFQRGKTIVSDSEDVESKESTTHCELEKTFQHPILGPISLVKVQIETGRMHQIRVHLADAGFPVLGDMLYGHPRINRVLIEKVKLKHIFLHCWKYSFWDNFAGNTVAFQAPIPNHFDLILKK